MQSGILKTTPRTFDLDIHSNTLIQLFTIRVMLHFKILNKASRTDVELLPIIIKMLGTESALHDLLPQVSLLLL
jgi:hypothetical protein